MQVPSLPNRATAIVTKMGIATLYFYNWLVQVQALLQGTLAQGFNGTITTAKLTTGGTEGSITFTNGVVTSQTAAT